MIVWTNQPYAVYETLMQTGQFTCDPKQAENWQEAEFAKAYQWMIKQMTHKIGPAPVGVTAPIWAWYKRNYAHQRPDFRQLRDFADQVCLEIEIADEDILLSDFIHWHAVLNDFWLSGAQNEAEYDEKEAWYQSLSPRQQQRVKEQSWQQIFDYTPRFGDWSCNGDTVQGCFWQLNRSQVRRAWCQQKGHRVVELGVSQN